MVMWIQVEPQPMLVDKSSELWHHLRCIINLGRRHRHPGEDSAKAAMHHRPAPHKQQGLPSCPTLHFHVAGDGLLLVETGSRLLTSSSWQPRITTARYTRVPKPWSIIMNPSMNQNLSRPNATGLIQNLNNFFFYAAIRS